MIATLKMKCFRWSPVLVWLLLTVWLPGCTIPSQTGDSPPGSLLTATPSPVLTQEPTARPSVTQPTHTPLPEATATAPVEAAAPPLVSPLDGQPISTELLCDELVAAYETSARPATLWFDGEGTLHGVGHVRDSTPLIHPVEILWAPHATELIEQPGPSPTSSPCTGSCDPGLLARSPSGQREVVAVFQESADGGVWLMSQDTPLRLSDHMKGLGGLSTVPYFNEAVWSDDGTLLWYNLSLEPRLKEQLNN